MRRFVTTVFDNWVYSTSTYTSDEHQALLGSVDELAIQAIANAVSGSAVELSVFFQSSSDGIQWTEQSAPIGAQSLLPQQNNVKVGSTTGTAMGRARLRVVLTGASAQARVRLIVCGRDRERTGEGDAPLPDGVVTSRTRAGPQNETPEHRAGTHPDAARPHRGTQRLEDVTP